MLPPCFDPEKFKEQRLDPLCTPVCSPKRRALLCFLLGVVFLLIGLSLLRSDNYFKEIELDYTAKGTHNTTGTGDEIEVVRELTLNHSMEPPIYIYYELEKFHQNHRQYLESVDPKQLMEAENPRVDNDTLPKCKPWVTEGEHVNYHVNYPCGLVARSIFSDSFVVLRRTDEDWERLTVNSSAASIAWPTDTGGQKFRNVDPEANHTKGGQNQDQLNMWLLERFPPQTCEQRNFSGDRPSRPTRVATRRVGGGIVADCTGYNDPEPSCNFTRGPDREPFNCSSDSSYELVKQPEWGVESGHFMVWMRIAGLEKFRKLWGSINETLEAGTKLRIYATDNFEVTSFGGKKRIVIATRSDMGRTDKLGYGYVGAGAICFVLGVWSALKRRPAREPDTLLDCDGCGEERA